MTLLEAVEDFAKRHRLLMLVIDPKFPDALEAAVLVFGQDADDFLDVEAIKAVSSGDTDQLFVLMGEPGKRLILTRAGSHDQAGQWFEDMMEWSIGRMTVPSALALVRPEWRAEIDKRIDRLKAAERLGQWN